MMNKDGAKWYPAMGTIFAMQKEFQKLLRGFSNYSGDLPKQMSESILGLLCEAGEVLQADQRWKTNGRSTYYNRAEKVEELADCFIFLVNACIYSDVSSFEIMNAISDKILKNIERYKNNEKT